MYTTCWFLVNIGISVVTENNSAQTRTLVKTPMRWADAQSYCRRNHKGLLSVKNLAENQEIQSMVPAGQLAWIGLSGDSWKWSDGSDSIFRYWGQGHLDDSGAGPNCAHYNGISKTWSTRSCDSKSMFFCYCKYITSSYKLNQQLTFGLLIEWKK